MALEALAAREKHNLETLRNATYVGPFEIPKELNLTGVITNHTKLADDRQIIQFRSM